MTKEELKQRLIELLDELYKRERIVSFKQIAEALVANGVTIRDRGEWKEGKTLEKCSVCGKKGFPDWNFCPRCGADMRGDAE